MADDTQVQSTAPPQLTPSPSTAPAPPPAAPNIVNAAPPAAPPIVQPSTPTGPTPQSGQDLSDPNAHHTMVGKIFSAIAGGKPNGYVQTDKGPVQVKTDWQPGQLARHIVASAASLIAAGTGGMLAAKQHRPFELAPGTSLGDIRNADQDRVREQAQLEFQNKQTADEATLRAHRDAMEQQKSIAELQSYADQHAAAVQARSLDPERNVAETKELNQRMFDIDVKNAQNYSTALAMPGAEVMKDAGGKELNFMSGEEAKAYVVAHPEAIHGRTGDNSKFGVVPVINPQTGQYQLIDYPAERHDIGIANFGQKKDAQGSPVFDKQGNPVPDGTVLDPKTKKPTVLTQTVTPDQARAIAAQNINQADVQAQMLDRQEQAKLRDSQAKKNGELSDAIDAYEMGNFDKMTPRQKALVARMTFQEQTLAAKREQEAEANLTKIRSTSFDDNDPRVKEAEAEYKDAKTSYDDATEKYNQLTGNTAGVQFANSIIRKGIGTTPWAAIDKQITDAPLSDDEKQVAKARVWNSLTPAQKGQANPTPEQPAPHKQVAAPVPEGQAVIFDVQGNPHLVAANLVDQYLASPQYKGWTK